MILKKTLSCFVFLLLSSTVEVNSQTCDSTTVYDGCSTNSACACFPIAGAHGVGVCAFLWESCSQLIPCTSSQGCADTNHICIHHYRCNDNPVCYPLSRNQQNICPSMSTVTNETTATMAMISTDTTSTTMKLDTPKKGVQFAKWKPNATTVAGGNGVGDKLNQLKFPFAISLDKNQNIFILEHANHRVVEWKYNATEGIIVAGGNGIAYTIDQLYYPMDVIVDEENNSLIIADKGNKRVIQWSLNQNQQEILIENIHCWGLTIDKYGFLYVSNWAKNEVRRWKIGEVKGKEGTLVAGGNGEGNQLNQLDVPSYIFVDNEQSIYVSDLGNHRVMKWRKGAKEGIIVAGGNGYGNNLNQLSGPQGIIVDDYGQIYVADSKNSRIMRWYEGKKEGEIIVGGNGEGNKPNQLYHPYDLSFDVEGDLYVSDQGNNRIQKFDLIS